MANKPKVLVVEDEKNIAEAEKIVLEAEYDVALAANGEEGIALAKELTPDVVILDWMMPKKSGIEVLEEIRSDASLKNTLVIMVTSKDTEADEAKGIDGGADDYIMKPFEPEELLHVVAQVLSGRTFDEDEE